MSKINLVSVHTISIENIYEQIEPAIAQYSFLHRETPNSVKTHFD